MSSPGALDGDTRTVQACLTVFGARPTPATVEVVDLSSLARLRRSVAGLAACWGGAGVAVFFPVLHLVLVPGLLVTGVVLAVLLGRQSRKVVSVRGVCPRCLSEQAYDTSGRVQRAQLITCPACHTNLTLTTGQTEAAGPLPIEAAAAGPAPVR